MKQTTLCGRKITNLRNKEKRYETSLLYARQLIFVTVLMHQQTPQCNIWGKPEKTKLCQPFLGYGQNKSLMRYLSLKKSQELTLLMLSHLVPQPAW